ncbi:hypothetical protein [Pantoea agglomerans]|uniref:hypothetical protein n=1 Tax=Enterobacter agglomerans TaxID=549 RepID=UPI002413BEA2|nr:hypothetical protein [Pantoea agglomerans]
MRERPILFNADMVCAVLDGRKTQTRRIMREQPEVIPKEDEFGKPGFWIPFNAGKTMVRNEDMYIACPFGLKGDRLWVRETWSDVNLEGIPAVAYRADGDVYSPMDDKSFLDEDGAFNYDDSRVAKYDFTTWYPDLINGTEGRWRPSIHMPRWASRITLEITGVRVERLASVSTGDARAEGYPAERAADGGPLDAWLWFRDLWDGIYPEQSFKVNPWVWVVEFKRVEDDQ